MNVKQPTLRVNTETAMRNQLSSTKLDIKRFQGIPWWSIGYDSVPSLPRAQGQLLVRELQSHRLWGLAKKKLWGSLRKCNWLFQLHKNSVWSKGDHQLHLPYAGVNRGAMFPTEDQYSWTHPEGPFKNIKKNLWYGWQT